MKTTMTASRREARFEYRLYCALLFMFCLPLALIGRVLPQGMRPFRAAPGAKLSVLAEARAAAHSAAPYVFMG